MAYEWKAGDRAMVEIVGGTDKDGDCLIKRETSSAYWVPGDTLHPLPAPDPHQALRDAVVEAAMAWKPASTIIGDGSFMLMDKIDALRAAMTPPDPFTEAKVAHDALMTAFSKCKDAEYQAYGRVEGGRDAEKAHTAAIEVLAKAETRWNHAIAALEAVRKVKP